MKRHLEKSPGGGGGGVLPYIWAIGGFHAISGDTDNNGEMNKCWWTNKGS